MHSSGSFFQVVRIYDGDSLQLMNGERLRLIGINTPELNDGGIAHQPFALDARDRLRQLVAESDGHVFLQYGEQEHDRYGRKLVHVFGRDGRNLAERLLEEGLGIAITVPPNQAYLNCYRAAEDRAKDLDWGLWKTQAIVDASQLKDAAKGFRLVRGYISRVGVSRKSVWLTLSGTLAIRIDKSDLALFPRLNSAQLVGKRAEVRGWLSRYRGVPTLRIRHPANLKID